MTLTLHRTPALPDTHPPQFPFALKLLPVPGGCQFEHFHRTAILGLHPDCLRRGWRVQSDHRLCCRAALLVVLGLDGWYQSARLDRLFCMLFRGGPVTPECFSPFRCLYASPWLPPTEATTVEWDSHLQG